jgi:hypothetical protein
MRFAPPATGHFESEAVMSQAVHSSAIVRDAPPQ